MLKGLQISLFETLKVLLRDDLTCCNDLELQGMGGTYFKGIVARWRGKKGKEIQKFAMCAVDIERILLSEAEFSRELH